MKKKRFNFHDVVKNIGAKSVVASVLIFALTVAVTCVGGYQLYSFIKESIRLQGEVNATKSAKEFDNYLIVRKNAVSLAGNVVDQMIKQKKSNKEILKYLEAESESIHAATDNDATGLYGWINGEYLDGDGWVPDKDFVATERPWYKETMESDSDVTFVRPYLDKQYNTIMTTMAVKLNDKKSVLAIDLTLAKIQEMTEKIAAKTPGSYGIVLDRTGQVVAHSKKSELGKNYMEEKGTLGAALAKEELDDGRKSFELNFNGKRYMVYAEEIEGGWKTLSLINTATFYRPLTIILTLLVLLTLLEATIFFVIFYRLSAKNMAISIQNVQIGAVADMYLSIYDIDLPYDSIREIRRGKNFDSIHVIGGNQKSAQDALDELYEKSVNEASKSIMYQFVDLDTLPERLAGAETITEEFLDEQKRWCRARFIVAERGKDGKVIRVLWMIESIDKEKKHRERLKYLSETDQMTGLYNRTTGEGKITGILNRGEGGMLVMIDVDKFKSINDTFGHDVGDKALIAVAKAIGNAFRSSDLVMRLGGDEFVAFAPDVVTEEDGRFVIDRVFRNLEKVNIEEMGERRIYLSVGAAICPKGEIMSFSEMYKKADSCTYRSKTQKGNTCEFYKEETTQDE